MKTGKKLVGVLLLLLVIVNFAFANGTSEAVEAEDELVTVKLYLPGAYTPGAEAVHAELNRRMGEDINVNVDIQYIGWGDYANKMNVMVASGDDYDANFDAVWLSYPF